MRDILFLSHRIPYPPDKGDKIRAWHILRHLASKHRVHLGTFIDDPDDMRHLELLERLCASVVWRPLSPRFAKLRSLRCFLSGTPLTQGYFGDPGLGVAIDAVVQRHRPTVFYVFSSAMAPYVFRHRADRMIFDFVDVDSEKWRQYATESSGLKRRLYQREGRKLLQLERAAAVDADAVLFVSGAEARLFTSLVPEAAGKSKDVPNGVNIDYFNPCSEFADPFGARAAVVFTGVMDYRPNVDAMRWFTEQVLPKLKGHGSNPCLWIVGSNPSRQISALAGPDVRVTGRVPDVRPYLKHASVVVAPLRIARGIQNKVLEAMSMGVPVVATPEAYEGLEACRSDEVLIAQGPTEFANAVIGVLDGSAGSTGARARARVMRDFSWQNSFRRLDELIEADCSDPNASPGVRQAAVEMVSE